MAKFKPKVFVGSSSEARKTAKAFCTVLDDSAIMIPWWLSPEFQAMHSTLEGLLDACNIYDFGLFILTPDDKFTSRGEKGNSARDNVLFELGLFLGKLGPNRTFAVIQESKSGRKRIKIPADLNGIVMPRFEAGDSHSLIAAVRSAADNLSPIIEREGRRQGRIKLASSWGYDAKTFTFSMTLAAVKLDRNKRELADKSLIVVARKYNENVDFEFDTHIAVGEPRMLSRLQGDLVLRAAGKETFANVKAGDQVTGHLLLAPNGYQPHKKNTVSEMLHDGCELLESKGVTVKVHGGTAEKP
jgi:CAP12/Pycsar effector protein, TIR domain